MDRIGRRLGKLVREVLLNLMPEALLDKDPVVLNVVGVGELDRLVHGDALPTRVAPEATGGVHEGAPALEVAVSLDDLLGD